MAVLRSKDIRAMGKSELAEKQEEIKKELMKLRAQKSAGSAPENPGRIKVLRRTLARIITIQNQKKEVVPNKNE